MAFVEFSTTVQQQKSGTSSSGNFRRAGSTGSLSTPLEIVSVLKGEELNYVERVAIVESIRVLDTAERLDLIDLLASKVMLSRLSTNNVNV